MKTIKKILGGTLLAIAAFGLIGCPINSTEEDENLTVEISESGTTEKTVTMTAPSDYAGETVFIVYTTDGSTPNVSFDSNEYTKDKAPPLTKTNIAQYVDYGTCNLYDEKNKPVFSSSTEITAVAFYVAEDASGLNKAYKSAKATKKTITIDVDTTTATDSDTNKSGNLTFKLSKTGNSFSTHYYDTSANTFKYGEKDHCYYQFQFSTKKSGSGNWYLYIRQLGNAAPIKSPDGTTNFVAKGTFTGAALNALLVTAGDLEMDYLNKDGTVGVDFATVSVTAGEYSQFTLNVTSTGSDKTIIQKAIDANNDK